MTSFRELVHGPRPTVGSWLQLADLSAAEMMATTGFDWLCIDLEHTATSVSQMADLIRVGDLAGVPMLVRLSGHDPVQIKRALDAGVRGIIAPTVNTADQAKAIVQAAYYPPKGTRGVGLSRAQSYGLSFDAYRNGAAEDIVVIAQIEHVEGVANLGEILAVDGIDGYFIGPYDLSGSVGKPGQFDDPDVKAALDRAAEFIGTPGSVSGIHVVDPDVTKLAAALEQGYDFVALASEMLILSNRLAEIGADLQAMR
jgi:2-dehydro-3-deoxyglucarate aldolase